MAAQGRPILKLVDRHGVDPASLSGESTAVGHNFRLTALHLGFACNVFIFARSTLRFVPEYSPAHTRYRAATEQPKPTPKLEGVPAASPIVPGAPTRSVSDIIPSSTLGL